MTNSVQSLFFLVLFVYFGHLGILAIVYCASDVNEPEFSDEYNEFTCPQRCNEWYSPVCGRNDDANNKMFVNPCYMSMENCNSPTNKGLIRGSYFVLFLICFFFFLMYMHINPTIKFKITQFKSNKNQKK